MDQAPSRRIIPQELWEDFSEWVQGVNKKSPELEEMFAAFLEEDLARLAEHDLGK